MKKLLLVGSSASGKTTLCQRLNGLDIRYHKTQAVEIVNHTIDTPGEYLEHRTMLRALVVTASDIEKVLFIQDASREVFMYSPGMAMMFPGETAGVITKIDIATPEQISQARELLELAGADPIFEISAITGEGIDELKAFLEE